MTPSVLVYVPLLSVIPKVEQSTGGLSPARAVHHACRASEVPGVVPDNPIEPSWIEPSWIDPNWIEPSWLEARSRLARFTESKAAAGEACPPVPGDVSVNTSASVTDSRGTLA